jgi:hypothetical protein
MNEITIFKVVIGIVRFSMPMVSGYFYQALDAIK